MSSASSGDMDRSILWAESQRRCSRGKLVGQQGAGKARAVGSAPTSGITWGVKGLASHQSDLGSHPGLRHVRVSVSLPSVKWASLTRLLWEWPVTDTHVVSAQSASALSIILLLRVICIWRQRWTRTWARLQMRGEGESHLPCLMGRGAAWGVQVEGWDQNPGLGLSPPCQAVKVD